MSFDIREYLESLDFLCPASEPLLNSPAQVTQTVISQLFSLCAKLKLNPYTKYHALHILFSLSTPSNSDWLYISLLISSKLYDKESLTVPQIHCISNISKRKLTSLETQALKILKHSPYEATLFEWVLAFIELCSVNDSAKEKICSIACLFIDFLYEEKSIIINVPVGALAAAVLNSIFVVTTLHTGEFMSIKLLAKSLHQDIDYIMTLSKFILRYSLGAEFYSHYDFE